MARNAQEKAKQEAEGTELYGHQSSTCRILSYKRAIFHILFFLGCSTNHPERVVDLLVVWNRLKGVRLD